MRVFSCQNTFSSIEESFPKPKNIYEKAETSQTHHFPSPLFQRQIQWVTSWAGLWCVMVCVRRFVVSNERHHDVLMYIYVYVYTYIFTWMPWINLYVAWWCINVYMYKWGINVYIHKWWVNICMYNWCVKCIYV